MLYRCVRNYLVLLFVLTSAQVNAEDDLAVKGHVARAAFTSRIENREPVDRVLVLNPPVKEVYFFTDLRNLKGHTITHRWEYQGRAVSNVPFVVKGDRWRVFSKKVFPVDSYGEWSVTVLDDNGWPLYIELFRYEPVDSGTSLSQQTRAAPAPDRALSE
jgi:hypothetical protein